MAKDTRLQKMLAECGIASRRKAEEMIAAGRVAVNGVRAQIGDKVDVKITDIDMENKKVSLSIRALLEEPEAEEDAPAEE